MTLQVWEGCECRQFASLSNSMLHSQMHLLMNRLQAVVILSEMYLNGLGRYRPSPRTQPIIDSALGDHIPAFEPGVNKKFIAVSPQFVHLHIPTAIQWPRKRLEQTLSLYGHPWSKTCQKMQQSTKSPLMHWSGFRRLGLCDALDPS